MYIEDLEFEATVLEAHRFDKETTNGRDMEKIFFDELSANLAELKAMPEGALKEPQHAAALTIAALCMYPENPQNPPKFCPECGDIFDENDK